MLFFQAAYLVQALCLCSNLVLVTAAELFISLSMQKHKFLVETWNMIVPTKIPLTLKRMGVEMLLQVDKVGKAAGFQKLQTCARLVACKPKA